jgi:cytochrome c-type biogenesis protein CcsB
MSRAIKREEVAIPDIELGLPEKVAGLWPIVTPLLLTALIIGARVYTGRPTIFLKGESLILLALIAYICAAVLYVTNIFVKERVLERMGLWTTVLGFAFNLSGWMIRWVEAGDLEGWKDGINGAWRYYPLDNLYALTLGFCAGAGLTTLVFVRKPKYNFVGALSMPILVVILALGMMLGSDHKSLPPILDSYWRPIHVTIATIGYGVCLVSFGLAFAYLLKDGIRSEAVAIGAILYGLLIFFTVGKYAIPLNMQYGLNPYFFFEEQQTWGAAPFRVELPYVGMLMWLTMVLLLGALVMFIMDYNRANEGLRKWGWRFFKATIVTTGITLALIFINIKTLDNMGAHVPSWEAQTVANWSGVQLEQAREFMNKNPQMLKLSPTSNPVELGGLIGLFVALLMVGIFSWKRKEVVGAMPSLSTIDSMLYRTVGVAFPLLTLLLITGAVWANESWGRYWGWDSKEVGALVAWMAYAGFLHTRIAHGWRGRRSAYFALLGFALVIFTWLGVSYLLPGLHSYA